MGIHKTGLTHSLSGKKSPFIVPHPLLSTPPQHPSHRAAHEAHREARSRHVGQNRLETVEKMRGGKPIGVGHHSDQDADDGPQRKPRLEGADARRVLKNHREQDGVGRAGHENQSHARLGFAFFEAFDLGRVGLHELAKQAFKNEPPSEKVNNAACTGGHEKFGNWHVKVDLCGNFQQKIQFWRKACLAFAQKSVARHWLSVLINFLSIKS
jgi:hypothetical protein